MFYAIGAGGIQGNIGGFVNSGSYISSARNFVYFFDGAIMSLQQKTGAFSGLIRPIRAFGNWTMGCMDSLACNYNPEAMADGSCTYADLGYDCEGLILITQENIYQAVDNWLSDSLEALAIYGHISNWDVSM